MTAPRQPLEFQPSSAAEQSTQDTFFEAAARHMRSARELATRKNTLAKMRLVAKASRRHARAFVAIALTFVLISPILTLGLGQAPIVQREGLLPGAGGVEGTEGNGWELDGPGAAAVPGQRPGGSGAQVANIGGGGDTVASAGLIGSVTFAAQDSPFLAVDAFSFFMEIPAITEDLPVVFSVRFNLVGGGCVAFFEAIDTATEPADPPEYVPFAITRASPVVDGCTGSPEPLAVVQERHKLAQVESVEVRLTGAESPSRAGEPVLIDDASLLINVAAASLFGSGTPGVTVSPTTVAVVEGSTTAALYEIGLNSDPPNDQPVVITVRPDSEVRVADVNGLANPDGTLTLVFLDQTIQTVAVTALDDDIDESLDAGGSFHVGKITHFASQQAITPGAPIPIQPGPYSQISIADVTVQVTDDDASSVSIADESGVEGTGDATPLTFTVQLDKKSDATVTVGLSTASGVGPNGAIEGTDFESLDTTLTFLPGQVEKTVDINMIGDNLPEGTETFTVDLAGATGLDASIGTASATGSIEDDDPGMVVFGDLEIAEGAVDSYQIGLATPPSEPVFITVTPDNEVTIASPDQDRAFQNPDGSLILLFLPDEVRLISIDVTAIQDEVDESLDVGATHQGVITHSARSEDESYDEIPIAPKIASIIDDDQPVVTIANVAEPEGNSDSKTFEFVVQLSKKSDFTIDVNYETQDGAAGEATLADNDYEHAAGTLVFQPGQDSKTILVVVNGDTDIEDAEDFRLVVSGISSLDGDGDAGPETVTATGTIEADDTLGPSIVVSPASVTAVEGGAPGSYNIFLTEAPTGAVAVKVTPISEVTVASGSTPVDPNDDSITLVFIDTTPQTVLVTASDDANDEATPHQGLIDHSATSNDGRFHQFAVPDVTVAVTDNDPSPTITIGTRTSGEGNTGLKAFNFDVDLNGNGDPSDFDVTVTFQSGIVSDTATEDVDYQSIDGQTLTFTPGQTRKTLTVNVIGDTETEPDETFTITMTAVDTNPDTDPTAVDTGLGTITNDERTVLILPASGAAVEGGTVAYQVGLSEPPERDVPVVVTVRPDEETRVSSPTAVDHPSNEEIPNDNDITLVFTNTDFQIVTVSAHDDLFDEPDTHLGRVSHTSASPDATFNGIEIPQFVLSITDNDESPTVAMRQSESADEGNTGTTPLSFSVDLNGNDDPSDFEVIVTIQTGSIADTAIEGTDYESKDEFAVTFAPGQTRKTFAVNLIGDLALEPDEAFQVSIVSATDTSPGPGPTIGGAPAVGTIRNDDAGILITPLADSVTEGLSTTYTIRLATAPAATAPVVVTLASDGQSSVSATGGIPGPNGELSLVFRNADAQTVTVTAIEDTIHEPPPQTSRIKHTITAPSGSPYAGMLAPDYVLTIIDDDAAVSAILLTHTGDSTNAIEAGTGDTYTVQLGAPPIAPAVVLVKPDNEVTITNGQGVANPDGSVALVFTPLDFGPQPIHVTAVNDAIDESLDIGGFHLGHITHTVPAVVFATGQIIGPLEPVTAVLDVSITDNDAATVSIADVSDAEGDAGTTDFTFDVTLDIASDATIITTVSTGAFGDSAIEGTDYASGDGQAVVFMPGSKSATVIVSVNAELLEETDETFTVTLTAPTGLDARLSAINGQATGTIQDDDRPPVHMIVEHQGASTQAVEGNFDIYTVHFDRALTGPVDVKITPDAQVSVSAQNQDSATSADGSIVLAFAPIVRERLDVTVTAKEDKLDEAPVHSAAITHESRSAVDSAFNGLQTVLNVIVLDGDEPLISFDANEEGTEGSTGTSPITFGLTMDIESTFVVTVTANTVSGTATEGDDFVTVDGTEVVFQPGETTKTVTVLANGDLVPEPDETFTVILTLPQGGDAQIDDGSATGTILNDDDGIRISPSTLQATEGSTSVASYGIVLLDEPEFPVTVEVTADDQVSVSSNGVVGTGSGQSLTLVFLPDETWDDIQTINVIAINDPDFEGPHTGLITHESKSQDMAYEDLPLTPVQVQITDNDAPVKEIVLLGADCGTMIVAESDCPLVFEETPDLGDYYHLRLGAASTETVIVTVDPDAEVLISVDGAGVSQGPDGTWRIEFAPGDVAIRTVTVFAVDDDEIELDHKGLITHLAESADAGYNGQSAEAQAAIEDNDLNVGENMLCVNSLNVMGVVAPTPVGVCFTEHEGLVTSKIPGNDKGLTIRILGLQFSI